MEKVQFNSLFEYSSHLQPTRVVTQGHCVRISTGAPLPPGADAVVQVEDTKLLLETSDGAVEIEIEILVMPSVGQDIRYKTS